MSKVNWREILGWSADQLEEIRYAGFAFLKEGKYEKAVVFFKALVVIDPSSFYDIQTLGALYLQMGNGEKALVTLDHALVLDPTSEPVLLNKVKALLMLNRRKEALDLAVRLVKSKDVAVANDASALVTAYT